MRLQSTHFFGQRLNTLRIQGIRSPLLAIRSLKLEVVSDTNQFDPLLGHLTLQVFPIVPALLVIVLIIDGTYNVNGREPPLFTQVFSGTAK